MRCTSFKTNTNWSKVPSSFKRVSKGDMLIGTFGFMADYLLAKQIGIVRDKYRAYIYATLKEVLPNKYGKIGKIGQQLLHEYDNYLTKYESNFLNDPDYINYKNYLQSPEFQQLKEYIKEIKSTKARLRIAYSFAMSYIEAKYRFKIFNSFLELDERYLGGVKEAWSKLSLWTTYSIGVELIDYIETLNEKYNVIEQIRYVENTDSLLVEKIENWYANRTLQDDFANFMRTLTEVSAQDIAKFSLGEAGSVILADMLRKGAVRSLHYLGLGAFELAKYTPFGRGLNIAGKVAWSIKEVLNRSVLAWIGWQIGVEWQLDGWIQFQLENMFKALNIAEDNIGGLTSKELRRLGSIMEDLINGEGKINPNKEAEFKALLEKASPNLIKAVYNRLKAMEFRQMLLKQRWKEKEEYIDDLFSRLFQTNYKISIKRIDGINDEREYKKLIKITKEIWKKDIKGFRYYPPKTRSGTGRDIYSDTEYLTGVANVSTEKPYTGTFFIDYNKLIAENGELINKEKAKRELIPEIWTYDTAIGFFEGEYIKGRYIITNPHMIKPVEGLEYRKLTRTDPEIETPEITKGIKDYTRKETIPILITSNKKMIYVKKRITNNTAPEYIPFIRLNEETQEIEIIRDENGEINILSNAPIGMITIPTNAYTQDLEDDPYHRYRFDFIFRDIRELANLEKRAAPFGYITLMETTAFARAERSAEYSNYLPKTTYYGKTYNEWYWIGSEGMSKRLGMHAGKNIYIDYTLPQELTGRTDIIDFLKYKENKLNNEIQITKSPPPTILAMLINQMNERRKLKIRKYNHYASIIYKKDNRKKVLPTPINKEMTISLSEIMNEELFLSLVGATYYSQCIDKYRNFDTMTQVSSPHLEKRYSLKMNRTLKIKQYNREEFSLMADEGIDEEVIHFIEEYNPLGCYLIKDRIEYTKYLLYQNNFVIYKDYGIVFDSVDEFATTIKDETTIKENSTCRTSIETIEKVYQSPDEYKSNRTITRTDCGTKIYEVITNAPVIEETFLIKVYGASTNTKIKLRKNKRGKIILAE